jgi:hypothetical protein
MNRLGCRTRASAAVQERLARAVGIQLVTMEGHGGTTSWDGIADALVPFLRQNCDGGKLSPTRGLMGTSRDNLPRVIPAE